MHAIKNTNGVYMYYTTYFMRDTFNQVLLIKKSTLICDDRQQRKQALTQCFDIVTAWSTVTRFFNDKFNQKSNFFFSNNS